MNTTKRYPPEVREHAVNLVLRQQHEHASEWLATQSIGGKIGCTSETLRQWLHQHERDTGLRNGVSTAEREQLKSLVIRSRINWLTWLGASSAPPDRSNRGSLTLRM